MKKVWMGFVIIILVLSLAACSSNSKSSSNDGQDTSNYDGNNGNSKNEKVELSLWRTVGKPTEDEYYKNLVEAFNNTQDKIVIKETSFPDDSYHDQVRAAALSKDLPDILYIDGVEMAYMA